MADALHYIVAAPVALSLRAEAARRLAKRLDPERDTMRAEYDFSDGVRGTTASRYRKGTNVVLLDPDVKALFPDSVAVNEALRTFARLVKRPRSRRPVRRPTR